MDIEICYNHYLVFRKPFGSIITLIIIIAHHRASTFLTVSLHYDSFWWRMSLFFYFVLFFVCDAFCLPHVFRLKTDTKPYFELLKRAPQDARFSRYCFDLCQKKVMTSTSHRSPAYSKEMSLRCFKVAVICVFRWQVRNRLT